MSAVCVSLLLAGCGSGGNTSSVVPSAGPDAIEHYQLLMVAASAELGTNPVADPMTFMAAPGAPATVGPLSVRHVAGIAPAKQAGPPGSPLLGADGRPLGITLGQWEKARGTVVFSCAGSKRRAKSTLRGLIPSATYSVFVVHSALAGPGRFTPWGDPAGTTNNFKASPTGTATLTNTLNGCLSNADDIIIIWHSDGKTHGKSPGKIGVDWHTSLIAGVF
jgi:hypothetical protein